jgi:hypothetical protein
MWKPYAPLLNTGLFREFATLDPSRPAIKGFADHHGALTNGVGITLGNSWGTGESFDFWEASILEMKELVEVWLMLTGKRPASGLQKIIRWHDDGVTYQLSNSQGKIATRKTNPDLLAKFARGDFAGPAWRLLQQELNERLQGVTARMLWNHLKLILYQVPQDLLSAMWLQFARAVDGDRNYLKCEGCNNWFEVASPDGGRRDKQFCGTACRARHWRTQKGVSK